MTAAETIYRVGQRWDERRKCARPPHRLSVPVISIGNLTVGGSGKTPVVELTVLAARARGFTPAILSRGYRGDPKAAGNDEYRLLSRRLPDVVHRQGPDRYEVGRALLAESIDPRSEQPRPDLIILDDGFQHRRLARDLDVVVLDATRPLGLGRLLPRGFCREPWTALARADAFVLSRRELASPEKLRLLRAFIRDHFPGRPLVELEAKPPAWRTPEGEEVPNLETGAVVAFAGIGNPGAFFADLRRDGVGVRETRAFPDHHAYRDRDLVELRALARERGARALVCTEKDGVKLEALADFAGSEIPILQRVQRLEVDLDPIFALLPAGAPATAE